MILRLIERLSIFGSIDDAISFVSNEASKGLGITISFANAHAINICYKNNYFLKSLEESDVVFRDGIGMNILLKMLNVEPGENLNGTDLIPCLLDSGVLGSKIAIIGSTYKELTSAKTILKRKGLDVIYTKHGFHNEVIYLKDIKNLDVDLILLAMGMPKQELLARKIRLLNKNVNIINGGAIIDFISGKVIRAPYIFRVVGMEWLWRFINEPRRLFKRYVIGNFTFLYHSLCFTLRSGSKDVCISNKKKP